MRGERKKVPQKKEERKTAGERRPHLPTRFGWDSKEMGGSTDTLLLGTRVAI